MEVTDMCVSGYDDKILALDDCGWYINRMNLSSVLKDTFYCRLFHTHVIDANIFICR